MMISCDDEEVGKYDDSLPDFARFSKLIMTVLLTLG
jgi:hypothetical protein